MKKNILNLATAKMLISLATIAVIVCIASVKHPLKENNFIAEKKQVVPPLNTVTVDYENYLVDASQKTTLKYQTGSIINIPDNAFVDKNGKPVFGKVIIKYREFHDPADFFVSGIPMTYDSAGVQYQFESAGMLEILAFQNGIPVFVDSTKKIIIEMASVQGGNKYNIYKFDSLSGNWNYLYKDHASGLIDKDKRVEDKKPASIEKTGAPKRQATISDASPLFPKKSEPANFHFDIETDSLEFPEFASYKGVKFEVLRSEKDFDPRFVKIIWSDIILENGKQKGSYLMTLINGKESYTFETFPVVEEKNYDAVMAAYKKLYTVRKDKETKDQKRRDSLNFVLNRERTDQNDLAKNYQQYASASSETQNMVQRTFVISGFGIWNSDCPASLPKGEQFAATYTDTLGKKLSFKTLYLVEKGRNAMFAIYSYSTLNYNPSKQNILWAVTNDNKLAIFNEKDFRKIKIKNDSCVIRMTVINKPITKMYEVRSVLNI